MIHIIIAIDGPSGAGKGTLAKRLAEHLGHSYLDTGLLYRATGFKMMQSGYELNDQEKAREIASHLTVDDFEDNSSLRNEVVAAAASQVAAYPQVREALLQFQRNFAHKPPEGVQGVVMDGRDIGTVVCPEAHVKLFITATVEERARRRLKELQIKGIDSIYEDVLEDVKSRDERDSKRDISPLKPSEDSYVLDTSDLTIDDVFKEALTYIEDKRHYHQLGSSVS